LYSTGNGLTGSYYNGNNFTTFIASRIDPTVNYNWGNGNFFFCFLFFALLNLNLYNIGNPGVTGVGADDFSVRWTGFVVPLCTATYTFYVTSGTFFPSLAIPIYLLFLKDDGNRLHVNGQSLINDWVLHAPTEDSATIALTANQLYSIDLEYFENTGGAEVNKFIFEFNQ
jgi:hypothetical protein